MDVENVMASAIGTGQPVTQPTVVNRALIVSEADDGEPSAANVGNGRPPAEGPWQ